jgi:sedoheptulokinase
MSGDKYILGIDVGTSKTAGVIVDECGQQRAVESAAHGAQKAVEGGRAEQEAGRIFRSVEEVVGGLPGELRAKIGAVGITGQMHGVVLADTDLNPVGALITWQDERCLAGDFLKRLREKTGYVLCSGFGCATLAWLAERRDMPREAVQGCTIGDWVTAKLCGRKEPVMDPTDAASWGLFDLETLNWDAAAVSAAGIPAGLLPKIVPCGSLAGTTAGKWAARLGIPADVPVAAALGDNQASLLATLSDAEHELGLTLGTGGQLSAVLGCCAKTGEQLSSRTGEREEETWPRFALAMPPSQKVGLTEGSGSYEYRPYPGGRYMAVACSLAGGSAWQWLAGVVEKWIEEMGLEPPGRDAIYQRMNELGWNAPESLVVEPHFIGERQDPTLRASIRGIGADNFDLGILSTSLARGIMQNLKEMLPAEIRAGRHGLAGSGNALRHNALLRQAAERVFEMPLRMSTLREEAACGAAKNAAKLLLKG